MLIPLGMAEWCISFWVTLTLTLTSGLISRFLCLEHISYLTANFPQMCLMLDQFLLGIRHVTVTFLVSTLFSFCLFIDRHNCLNIIHNQ